MNEDQYRQTYKEVNHQRCVFEKLILLHYGNCQHCEKLLLAEREAYACRSTQGQYQCKAVLEQMRQNARFSLQQTNIPGPLPHGQEIKVQAGGIFGLQQTLENQDTADIERLQDDALKFGHHQSRPIEDVSGVIANAIGRYEAIEHFPFSQIVKAIIHFSLPNRKERKKRHRKGRDKLQQLSAKQASEVED